MALIEVNPPAIATLLTAFALMAHIKTKGSSVLIHHASHGKIYGIPWLDNLLGDLIGIVSLSIPLKRYREIHQKHHAFWKLAQLFHDEEATELYEEGFRPGRSVIALRMLALLIPLNPWWHVRTSWRRLQANFFSGPPIRMLGAWAFWGGLASIAGALTLMPGFLGAVLLLLVGGNIGAYGELVTRHYWNVNPQAGGRERVVALCQWRHASPIVPEKWTFISTSLFILSVFSKTLIRLCWWAGDLPHHPQHHLGQDSSKRAAWQYWADTALAYSEPLRQDETLHSRMRGSWLEAVDAWLVELSKQPALDVASAQRQPR
ncbi:hypothetical protein JY96_06355 [Aquabacterium sp. NJ1]|uniref:fatty acid desaturase n=1 Tax=Aquabacterium sp. NJ1 TaxID=1538295 RepID=UPI00052DAC79|nr:fatty acid desaturase [Aquabacterium sp. NJ1]KGM39776.1 hypothetical protein JY96_06355 [Aquabacterium sp. NJ1]